MSGLDLAWCEAVVRHVQPVLDEDGSDWSFGGIADPPTALLWEALPTAFVTRHPDAGIEYAYGQPAASIPCLDFWVYLERSAPGTVDLSWEGWDHWPETVAVSGDGEEDGPMLAARLRAHLRLGDPALSPLDDGS